ncbi:MAG: trypsin-like peptidase domain-containing protein [Methyloligellaceae bacterium]
MKFVVPRMVFSLVLICAGFDISLAQSTCSAPDLVCAAKTSVYRVVGPAGDASAVRIGSELLITNRQVIGGQTKISIRTANGQAVTGTVLPSGLWEDLILVRAILPEGEPIHIGATISEQIYTIGFDRTLTDIVVHPAGKMVSRPVPALKTSRIHHTSHRRSGTSGSALVNQSGELIGISLMGHGKYFSAISGESVEILKSSSGQQFLQAHRNIGKAYTTCMKALEFGREVRRQLSSSFLSDLERACVGTRNSQFIARAAKLFQRMGQFSNTKKLLNLAATYDPDAIAIRLDLISSHVFRREFEEAQPYVAKLLSLIPESEDLQSYALQVGRFTKNEELIQTTLDIIKKHNPQLYDAAQNFLKSDLKPVMRGSFN